VVSALATALVGLGVGQAPSAFAAAPIAAKVAPAMAQVGTGVTLAGEFLAGTSAVTFLGADGPADDVAAPNFIVLDPKKVLIQVPPGAETGPVEVTTPEGTASTGAVIFTILKAPTITSLSVSQGKPGDDVVVTGTNLMGLKKPAVVFGNKTSAPLVGSTQTQLVLKVPAGLAGGPTTFKVTTTGGVVTAPFYISPLVTAVTPVAGNAVGGAVASVLGAGFTGVDNFSDDPGTAGVDERFDGVTVGGVRVTKLVAVSDKEVVVKLPPGTDAAAPVVASTTDGTTVGTSNNSIKFAYQPTPIVTAVSQNWNLVNDPQPIVYTGLNFTSSTVVKVGGVDPVSAVVDEVAGTITVTPPAGVKPAVTAVTFTNTANAIPFTATSPFAYVGAPVVAKLLPATGQAGTPVLISGANFGFGTTVLFNATPATCTIVSYVLLRCEAPAGTGQVDVTVTNGAGTSVTGAATKFLHVDGTAPAAPVAGAPFVSALAPAYGTTGSTVDIKGINIGTTTQVEFTGAEDTWVNAPNFLVVGPGRVVVTVPSDAVTGELRITTPVGRVISTTKIFTRTVRPTIDSVDVVGDNTFAATPGDMLTIKGSGLLIKGVKTEVTVGGVPAPILVKPIPTSKTLVVKLPANVGGRYSVVLKTPLGSDTADTMLFYGPEVKSIKPATWSRTGVTIVTIGGFGFMGADSVTVGEGRLGAVTFGGVEVARMVQVSDKMLVVTTSVGSASAEDMIVTTQHDTKFATSEGKIRSVTAPIPRVTAVSPDTGPTGGVPPAVTLTGEYLTASSVVKFGASTGTVQSAAPDGTTLVVVPPTRALPATVSITVINVDEGDELTTTKLGAYTYELQAAVITGMSATTAVAGTTVTITGTSFVDVTSVTFATTAATFTPANENTIFATVPAAPPGAAGTTTTVTVVNATGDPSTASPATADDWTWDNSPTITGLSGSTAAAGTTITITGSNFTGATRVRFGYNDATSYTVVNPTTITAVVPNTPAGLGGQTVDLVVEVGTFVSLVSNPAVDNWTWMAPAVVTAMSSHGAPAGTVVTVTGTGFTSLTSVAIHTKAVSYTLISATSLTFVAPAGDANGPMSVGSKRDMRIVNGSGLVSTASPLTADDWTFQ
jgi:hypothetical protein